MAGFATETALQTALDAQNLYTESFYKDISITGVAGQLKGTFLIAGGRPTGGSSPASTPGTAYDSGAGGIVFPNTSPLQKHLLAFGARTDAGTGGLFIYDRLVGVGGIAVSSTGDKTVNSTALTRYTGGTGIEVYLEVATAGNTTAPIVSMSSYTNQSGTSGRAGATITFSSNNIGAGGLVGPMPLQSGDTGVRSVETINVATAGGGSGVVNVLLVKRLAGIPILLVRQYFERVGPRPYHGMPRIYDGATLMFAGRINGSGGFICDGWLSVVFG